MREAATYYDPNEVRVVLTFSSAFTGNLHLYAVDWDTTSRRETLSVNGTQVANLSSDFSQGAWVTTPVSVSAGGTITVTVDRTAGANAVLSGIFWGDAGTPPPPDGSGSTAGNWVGMYGASGYDLGGWSGGDLSSLPGSAINLAQGSRYLWAGSTSDGRALESQDQAMREAATYYDPNEVRVVLTFSSAFTGNLHLYAVDWDTTSRRETLSVNGTQVANLSSDFSQGAWVTTPVSVSAGGTITVTVDRTAGANAVLSGIFWGDAGTPPPPA